MRPWLRIVIALVTVMEISTEPTEARKPVLGDPTAAMTAQAMVGASIELRRPW